MATKNRPLNCKVDDPHFVWPPCLCQTPPGRQRLQRSSAIGTTATLPTTRHPPDARCTMADQPRRCWCTYQQHCGNAGSGVIGARTSGIAGMPGPHESGQSPAGDRPKERRAPTQDWRAPTQRLAGAFLNKKRLNDLTSTPGFFFSSPSFPPRLYTVQTIHSPWCWLRRKQAADAMAHMSAQADLAEDIINKNNEKI